tara:strand:- start:1602 stop:2870 length:1269 start_codon:yes stop_codon:yes gene_type:complete
MLEINKIKSHSSMIIQNLQKRGVNATENIKTVLDLDSQRITNQQKLDNILAEGNKIAQQIGIIAREKKLSKIDELKKRASEIKIEAKNLAEKGKEIEKNIQKILVQIPNVPHLSVPEGTNSSNNVVEFEWDCKNQFSNPLPHWELAEKYNIIDFKKGAEITGSGFPLYKAKGAKLQRGLINFFLDYNIKAGYEEYIPPYFVNEKSAFNTGQLPDKEGMMYHIQNDNLYVIPTAEVPITNIFNNTRLKSSELPIKCTAYSPCFRREAGSYGKEVRGLNRLHQFDKVEIVQICESDKSYKILDAMVEHVSQLLQLLELKFRIVKLCGGDLGFTSAMTYDFEVYAPGQKKWLEVSSVSNFETYQANRLNLKYINADKQNILCHTLNGSALALPRVVVAILEQHQQTSGITMPPSLLKYLDFDQIT